MEEDALKKLNSFFEEENLKNFRSVLQNFKDEGELQTGIGIHLFAKLTGRSSTTKGKAVKNCPCGCSEKLEGSDRMWIGRCNTMILFFFK